MRYQLDKAMEFRHSGTITNCANSNILNPNYFIITSRITHIKTGKQRIVTVNKDEELVEFVIPANTLEAGAYEWRVFFRNDMVTWATPVTIIEVV